MLLPSKPSPASPQPFRETWRARPQEPGGGAGQGWEELVLCLPEARVVRATQKGRPQGHRKHRLGVWAGPAYCQILAKFLYLSFSFVP